MSIINPGNWVKGQSYQKRILIEDIKNKINLIEDVTVSPKREIPCHSHNYTDEIFYITENPEIMIIKNDEFKVKSGDLIYV